MFIELSHLIQDSLPAYPGDSLTRLDQHKTLKEHKYNNHELHINMHAGTHVDGPMHLTDSPRHISDYPIDTFIGDGCLLQVQGEQTIRYKEIYEERVQENQIVLLHTGHGEKYGQSGYFTEYPVLSLELAELFVRKKVKLVGMDTPSPDTFPFEVHRYLFEHDILLIENLTNLSSLEGIQNFEIIALPLYIRADSSITRVVARVK
ncbi:cyclase family protein [Paenibacillus sp. HJL G12]|uniref:Cyclase family protein n=1 Tax=Paenibacillus dendrobii TaxID=2691084 RepID=A0A7X3LHJ6_9BACL|nr:cyclase family protein [Paenibacillus dendrobii]MWV44285.1 cyclase family protein [Paenibacillus dendrobii]